MEPIAGSAPGPRDARYFLEPSGGINPGRFDDPARVSMMGGRKERASFLGLDGDQTWGSVPRQRLGVPTAMPFCLAYRNNCIL